MSLKDGLSWDRHGQNKSRIISYCKIKVLIKINLQVIFVYNSENSRKPEKNLTASNLNAQKEQKVSDRIQDKLSMFKTGYESKPNP